MNETHCRRTTAAFAAAIATSRTLDFPPPTHSARIRYARIEYIIDIQCSEHGICCRYDGEYVLHVPRETIYPKMVAFSTTYISWQNDMVNSILHSVRETFALIIMRLSNSVFVEAVRATQCQQQQQQRNHHEQQQPAAAPWDWLRNYVLCMCQFSTLSNLPYEARITVVYIWRCVVWSAPPLTLHTRDPIHRIID